MLYPLRTFSVAFFIVAFIFVFHRFYGHEVANAVILFVVFPICLMKWFIASILVGRYFGFRNIWWVDGQHRPNTER